MVETLSSEAQETMRGHVMPGGMEEVTVSEESLAYDVQGRARKVPRSQHMHRCKLSCAFLSRVMTA